MRTAVISWATYVIVLAGPSVANAAPELLVQAIQAYENLEYESALSLLNQARDTPMLTPQDKAAIYLYLGLVRFSKGERDLADQSFGQALDEDASVTLPAYTSPKIAERFDAVRAKRAVVRSSESHTWTYVAGASAIAFAGVGVYFGVRAHANAEAFDKAQYADDAAAKRTAAIRDTHAANAFYAVAGAAAVTAVVLYFVEGDATQASTGVSVTIGPSAAQLIARW